MVIFTTIKPDPLLTLTRDFGPSERRMYFLKYIFKSFSLLIHFQHIVSPNSQFSEILKRKKMSERFISLHHHLLQKLEYSWHLVISHTQPKLLTCGSQRM